MLENNTILSDMRPKNSDQIFDEIEISVHRFLEYEKRQDHVDFGDWESRFLNETFKLINKDYSLNRHNLENFRGLQIFVADRPSALFKKFYHSHKVYYQAKRLLNLFLGTQRGGIQEALDTYCVLEKMGFLKLLKKYPTPAIGNPLVINYKDCQFTNRYIRHVYSLGIFLQYLRNQLSEDAIMMDIGSSYGIFSSLIKQEMPHSYQVLVDMPGQLILAHYYLSRLFPQAKIAGFKEILESGCVDRSFIKQYDFILVPTTLYHLIKGESIDLVTNFISFSEMSRKWFDVYFQSAPVKTASFIYTVNRYDSYPTYTNNITFLDYPFEDFDPIFVRNCPFLLNYYASVFLFGFKKVNYPSQFFQFIGRRKKEGKYVQK